MAQSIHQIEGEIEDSREDLRSNLQELGQKVQSAVDWRERVRSNPAVSLAIAFGGGMLLAAVLRRNPVVRSERDVLRSQVGTKARRVTDVWDEIKGTLVGVLAKKVSTTLADAVAGVREESATPEDHTDSGTPAPRPH